MKVISKMGISTVQSYHGAQVFEALGLSQDFIDEYFTGTPTRIGGIGIDAIAREVRLRHDWAYPKRPVDAHDARDRRAATSTAATARTTSTRPRRSTLLQTACRTGDYKLFKRYSELVNRQGKHPVTLRGLMDFRPLAKAGPARGGRAGRGDPRPLQDGRDVVRLDQPGGARGARHRDEPDRRKEQHGRGGRGPGPVRAAPERRLEEQRHQAGRLRAVRRDEPVPRQGPRAPDQDGAGGQAGRGGPAPRSEGLPVDREGAVRDARRRPHLAAAAPRHLLDRGPRPADPRPEEREPGGPDQREARRRGRGRDDRGRRRQGARRRHPHQRPRRRDGGLAPHEHPPRRDPVGARPRRGAPGPRPQQPPEPRRASRRTASSRPGATSSSRPSSAPRSSASRRRRSSPSAAS